MPTPMRPLIIRPIPRPMIDWGKQLASGLGGVLPYSVTSKLFNDQLTSLRQYLPDQRLLASALYDPKRDLAELAKAELEAARGEAQAPWQLAQGEAEAEQASLNAQLAALNGLQVPQRTFAPYTPTQSPRRQQVPVPERGKTTVPTLGLALAGLLGLAAPEGAASFTEASLRGAVNEQERAYNDRLRQFEVASQDASQRYAEESQDWQAQNAAALSNLRGREGADFENASARYNAGLAKAPLAGQRASLVARLGTDGQPGSISRGMSRAGSTAASQASAKSFARAVEAGMAGNREAREGAQRAFENRAGLFGNVLQLGTSQNALLGNMALAGANLADAQAGREATAEQARLDRAFRAGEGEKDRANALAAESLRLSGQTDPAKVAQAIANGAMVRTDSQKAEEISKRNFLQENLQTQVGNLNRVRDEISKSNSELTPAQIDRAPIVVQARRALEQAADELQAWDGVPEAQRTFPEWAKTHPTRVRPGAALAPAPAPKPKPGAGVRAPKPPKPSGLPAGMSNVRIR